MSTEPAGFAALREIQMAGIWRLARKPASLPVAGRVAPGFDLPPAGRLADSWPVLAFAEASRHFHLRFSDLITPVLDPGGSCGRFFDPGGGLPPAEPTAAMPSTAFPLAARRRLSHAPFGRSSARDAVWRRRAFASKRSTRRPPKAVRSGMRRDSARDLVRHRPAFPQARPEPGGRVHAAELAAGQAGAPCSSMRENICPPIWIGGLAAMMGSAEVEHPWQRAMVPSDFRNWLDICAHLGAYCGEDQPQSDGNEGEMMWKLTETMKRLIENYNAGAVGTTNEDGTPAVSPKATFVVIDDGCIAFGNIRSPGTIANIRSRPDVEVNFIDVLTRRAVRIKGQAEIIETESEAGQRLFPAFEEHWGEYLEYMQNFVSISITHAELILSPAYDVGHTAAELRRANLDKLSKIG